MGKRPHRIATVGAAILSFGLMACNGRSPEATQATNNPSPKPAFTIPLDNLKKVLNTNAEIAYALYSDSVDTAKNLQIAIHSLAEAPSQQTLDNAKLAWLVAREPYGQTEVYRFRLSPIDSTNYQDEDGPEGAINAWPLGEALIDYTVTGSDFNQAQLGVTTHKTGVNYPLETLINSAIALTPMLLEDSATAGDERDVISGYHAIEFMLWGQDLNRDGSADTLTSRELSTTGNILNSGGQRPVTDFTTSPEAKRRHQYLAIVTDKLIKDLTQVRDAWAPGAPYRTAFTQVTTEAQALEKITEILTGMGTLSEGELAGERIQIAYTANSQEDEHSCFSDNTHRDIWLNAEGVANSYFGVYQGYDSTLDGKDNETARAVSGYGFDDLIKDAGLSDSHLIDLGKKLSTALVATAKNTQALDQLARQGQPFDVLIMDVNRKKGDPIYNLILSLNHQSVLISQLAAALNLSASVVDSDASACNTHTPLTPCE